MNLTPAQLDLLRALTREWQGVLVRQTRSADYLARAGLAEKRVMMSGRRQYRITEAGEKVRDSLAGVA